MNLIDRAARALAASQQGQDAWDKLDVAGQERFRDGVRVALNALRDPDDRMAQAGAEIIRNVGREESGAAHLNDAANTWRFMIDALLATETRSGLNNA
jgi:hypothetical protein